MSEALVCIVTGSSQGIGRTIALTLGKAGSKVVVNDLPSRKEAANAVAKQIESEGGSAITILADVGNQGEVQRMFDETVAKWKTVDVLVNNAGIKKPALVADMTPEEWHDVIGVNLSSVFYATQAALKIMQEKKKGRIVSLSSIVGVTGIETQANYAAAKAGIGGLMKTAAREYAGFGITCNAVAPGMIDTDFIRDLPEGAVEQCVSVIPMGRLGKPEEVAELIKFLTLNPGAAYITGQVININGGWYM